MLEDPILVDILYRDLMLCAPVGLYLGVISHILTHQVGLNLFEINRLIIRILMLVVPCELTLLMFESVVDRHGRGLRLWGRAGGLVRGSFGWGEFGVELVLGLRVVGCWAVGVGVRLLIGRLRLVEKVGHCLRLQVWGSGTLLKGGDELLLKLMDFIHKLHGVMHCFILLISPRQLIYAVRGCLSVSVLSKKLTAGLLFHYSSLVSLVGAFYIADLDSIVLNWMMKSVSYYLIG